MKTNGVLVKSIVVLGLVSSIALASNNDIETNDDNGKDIVIKSSIQIPQDATEAVENSSAKITADEALKTVQNKFSGKILSVKLENENGNLIYASEVMNNNQITDVIVDAGDGKILASNMDKKDSKGECDDEEEHEHHEAWYKFWK